MKLHDTLSRTVRDLRPRDGRTFRFYCCGPTVYGPAHIGNFRTFVLQDVFRRTIELSGVPIPSDDEIMRARNTESARERVGLTLK